MNVVLVDGTYELFRHFYALPPAIDASGQDTAAVRGVLRLVMKLLNDGATHVGVATDHVIESFRNGLLAGYKTGQGSTRDFARSLSRSNGRSRKRALPCGR